MNKKGGAMAYIFWMIVGAIIGGVFASKYMC